MGQLYWEKHFQELLCTCVCVCVSIPKLILFENGVGEMDIFNLKELKQELNLKKVSRELKLKSYLWNSKHRFNKTIYAYNTVSYTKTREPSNISSESLWLIWSVTRRKRWKRVFVPSTLAMKSKNGRKHALLWGGSLFFPKIKIFFLLSWFCHFPTKLTEKI